MTVTLLEGHVTDVLAGLPAGHFHTVVTSPPYAWLRAYSTEPQVWQTADGDALCAPEQHEWHRAGMSGTRLRNGQGSDLPGMQTEATRAVSVLNPQMGAFCEHCHAWRGELGQEPSPELYVEHLVAVFRAVRRVLRADGSLWVNLAGSYYSEPGGQNGGLDDNTQGTGRTTLTGGTGRLKANSAISLKAIEANRQNGRQKRGKHPWLKPLDWVDVPGLFARAMQQDGWTWRSDVVWVKPSALPESVSGTRWERCRVRLAAGHRSTQPAKAAAYAGVFEPQSGVLNGDAPGAEWADCPGCQKCAANEGLVLRRGSGRPTKTHEHVLLFTRGPGYFFDTDAVREQFADERMGNPGTYQSGYSEGAGRNDAGTKNREWLRGEVLGGRNLRDVWTISPEPLKDAHYAAYPSALPERCIRAGTSEWGCCPSCGAPWARVLHQRPAVSGREPGSSEYSQRDPRFARGGAFTDAESTTLGWRPTCAPRCPGHDQPPVPCRTLDIFGGSGTTALAANRLGRDCTLVELKPQYAALARKRVGREPLSLFAWQGQEAMTPAGAEAPPLETTKQEQHPTRTVRGFNQRWKASHGAGGLEDTPEEVQV